MEREEPSGRSVFKRKPLTCYKGTVVSSGIEMYSKIPYVETEHGFYRLAPGVDAESFEKGETYFFQTIVWNFKWAPIEVVDYVKL